MLMIWNKELYFNSISDDYKEEIVKQISEGELQTGIYIITLAVNNKNHLEIYPCQTFLQPYYKNLQLVVVGVADGYNSALQLVTNIVSDTYMTLGEVNIKKYFNY
jgi:hypothetical protein